MSQASRILSMGVAFARKTPAAVLLVVAMSIVAALVPLGTARAAYPCEPPSACTAHFYGYNMKAWFLVDGFGVAAFWNFTSTSSYQAWPRSGHSTEVYHLNHQLYTTGDYPTGTWNRSQWSKYEGVLNSWPANYSVAMGPNVWASEFNHQLAGYLSPLVVFDNIPKARATAALYPSGGASAALNNTRDECKNLTVNGATSC